MAERYGDTFSKPQSPAEVAQDQLRALKLGLDLQSYQIYKRAPKDWTDKHQNNFDSATGKFKFDGMVPGALQSNGGPVTGPGGMILAAGSTADKPINLSSLTQIETPSEKWAREHAGANATQNTPAAPPAEVVNTGDSRAAGAAAYHAQLAAIRTQPQNKPGQGTQINYTEDLGGAAAKGSFGDPNATYGTNKTFLPPYLQPKPDPAASGAPQANTNVPGPGAVAPVAQPAPAPTSSAAPSNPFGIAEKPSMSLPYYLRNAKKTRGIGGVVAYG